MRRKLSFYAGLICLLLAATMGAAAAQGSQYYFPQVADGVYSAGFYSTSITISNIFSIDNVIKIRFTRTSGAAWAVDLRSADRPEINGRRSLLEFTLRSKESVLIYTSGIDALAVGWAMVESVFPVVASEFFGVMKSSPVTFVNAEAGVLPSVVTTQMSFFADVSRNEPVEGTDIDTGFAIANPSASAANITATLISAAGATLGDRQISLAAGAHTAMFVSELFRTLSLPAQFHGRVRFSSNVNIAVVALRQAFRNSETISTVSVVPEFATQTTVIYDREPNDSLQTAQPIDKMPAEIIGTMNAPNDGPDFDIFSVYLLKGDTLFVFVLADLINSTLDGSVIIWDSNANEVAKIDTFSDKLADPFVRYQVPADGYYYIDHGSVRQTSSRNAYYKMYIMYKEL